MKRLLFILLVIISLGSFSSCFSQNEPNNQQAILSEDKLEDPYFWDFGTVKEGSILEHVFVLKNELRNTLNIKDLQASCSCTVSDISTRNIPPSGEAKLKVTFDTKDRLGNVTQYVYVVTDDIYNPINKFTVTAQVIKK